MWQAKDVTQVWFAAPYDNWLALIGYLLVFPGSEVTLSDLEWDLKARITRQEIDLVSQSSESPASSVGKQPWDVIEIASSRSDQGASSESEVSGAISEKLAAAPIVLDSELPQLPAIPTQR